MVWSLPESEVGYPVEKAESVFLSTQKMWLREIEIFKANILLNFFKFSPLSYKLAR